MSSAPIYRDQSTRTQSAVRRGAPGAQSGARKVVGRTNTDGVVPSADTASIPVGWEAYRVLSQSLSGSGQILLDTLLDTQGDTGWLNDNGDGTWSLGEEGFYEIHVYSAATTTRAAGNCVTVERISGFDFPTTGTLASIPFTGTSGSVTSLIVASQCLTKTVVASELGGGTDVQMQFTYLGGAVTLHTYVTFVKVL